ncbi:MAG TPA: MlaD family protein [Candidatus Dormibacteraeota bacterium]|nr:MlaD family protein [Candidatus Dormibacteraeota bacterium]
MATEARKLRVGIFVIVAIVIGLAAAIWLGASRYLADESQAVTYFSESVQGLDPGAAVKYRGVPAGRVDRIGIAPDGDLIEVVMSINNRYAGMLVKDPTLRAQLQLSGITGLRYVEIDRHTGTALENAPTLSFEPQLPLIPSTPSQFKAIQEALEDIYRKVMSVDLEGISSDTRATLQAADRMLRDERVQTILTNLANVSESASRVTLKIEKAIDGVRLEPVVAELRQATNEAKGLMVELREGQTGRDLRSAMREVDGLARTSQSFVLDLQGLVERLNRTTDNLQLLTDALRQQPSTLLFSSPPPPRPAREH